MANFVVNLFTSTSTLLSKYRKTQYTFSLSLPNYQPNNGKDTYKFSFFKRKPTSSLPPTLLNPNSPNGEVSSLFLLSKRRSGLSWSLCRFGTMVFFHFHFPTTNQILKKIHINSHFSKEKNRLPPFSLPPNFFKSKQP